MNSCGQPGQLWRVAHPAHRHYYDDEIGYHSVVKLQGGRFFNVKVGGFSKLIHRRNRFKYYGLSKEKMLIVNSNWWSFHVYGHRLTPSQSKIMPSQSP